MGAPWFEEEIDEEGNMPLGLIAETGPDELDIKCVTHLKHLLGCHVNVIIYNPKNPNAPQYWDPAIPLADKDAGAKLRVLFKVGFLEDAKFSPLNRLQQKTSQELVEHWVQEKKALPGESSRPAKKAKVDPKEVIFGGPERKTPVLQSGSDSPGAFHKKDVPPEPPKVG